MNITAQQFEDVYSTHNAKLLKSSFRILNDFERASDVVQECFLRLTKQDFSKIEDHVVQWLFTVCRNLSLKQLAKNKRLVFLETSEIEHNLASSPDPMETLADKEDTTENTEYLYSALKRLRPRTRRIIEMRYIENLSYKEISEKMKLTEGNVGYILSTSLKKLKNILRLLENNAVYR